MEFVQGMTLIAVSVLIGMGALGTAIGLVCLAGAFLKGLQDNQRWSQCCRSKCLSLQAFLMP